MPNVHLLTSKLIENLLQRRVRTRRGNQRTEHDDRGDQQGLAPAASRQAEDLEVADAGEQHGGQSGRRGAARPTRRIKVLMEVQSANPRRREAHQPLMIPTKTVHFLQQHQLASR